MAPGGVETSVFQSTIDAENAHNIFSKNCRLPDLGKFDLFVVRENVRVASLHHPLFERSCKSCFLATECCLNGPRQALNKQLIVPCLCLHSIAYGAIDSLHARKSLAENGTEAWISHNGHKKKVFDITAV